MGIVNMLEWIRRKLMTRFNIKRSGMEKHDWPIGPKIQKKREVKKIQSRSCSPLYAGTREYEIACEERTLIVNLINKTCGCQMWDLSGILCKHAVCAICAHREQSERHVHPYNSIDFYLATYSFIIHPIPTHHEWVTSELKRIQSPHYHKPTGRPRKQRKRAEDEPKNPHKSSRKNLTVTCARCSTIGHNSRACKLPPDPDSKLFKSTRGSDSASTSRGAGSSHGVAK